MPIRTVGLPGLQPKWGDFAPGLTGYRGVVGDATQSCVDIEYYFDGWPLQASILVDAEQPGQTPPPLPDEKPLAGTSNVYEAPAASLDKTALTALRLPDAWLVVSGGKGPAQRLEALRHLHPIIA